MRRIVVLALMLMFMCEGPLWAFHPRRKRSTPVVLQSASLYVGPFVTPVVTTYYYPPPQVIRTYTYEYESYGSGGVIIQQPTPILYPRR